MRFYLKCHVFERTQNMPNICTTFVQKIVPKTLQKSPKLVTLIRISLIQ